MSPAGVSAFITAIGVCAMAWRPSGVVGVSLPEAGAGAALDRLARRHPDLDETTPPPEAAAAIAAMISLLDGHAADLGAIALDLGRSSPFERQVYDITRAIPPGQVITYGQVAERLGEKRLAREVGQALGRNPCPIIVPCHRVIGADGRMVGFSGPGGIETKRRMLAIEGYYPGGQPTLFD